MKLVPRKPINPDDAIGRGMDFALVIVLFLGIGYVLDRVLDTKPAFMIGCFLFAVIGQFVRMWTAYDTKMKQLEADRLTVSASRPRPEGQQR